MEIRPDLALATAPEQSYRWVPGSELTHAYGKADDVPIRERHIVVGPHRCYLLGVLGLLVVGVFPTWSTAKPVDRAESSVEIDEDGGGGRTINRTFEAVVEGREHLLLRTEVDRNFSAEFPGGPGHVRIDAWPLSRARGHKPLYTITDQADEVGWLISGLLLTTRVRACCDSRGSRAVFSASTGRLLLYADGNDESHLAMIFRPGSLLMLGVLDQHGGRHPRALPPYQDGHMALLVSEADDSTCRRQLTLDLRVAPKTDTRVRSIAWKNVTAQRVDGLHVDLAPKQPLSGTLEIEISDQTRIAIPVGEKGLDSSRVVLPQGATMQVVSPCVL